jgi:hypothetical protein
MMNDFDLLLLLVVVAVVCDEVDDIDIDVDEFCLLDIIDII